MFRKPPRLYFHFTVMNTDTVDLVSQVHALSDSMYDIIHLPYAW